MATQPLYRPDVEDIHPSDIVAAGELQTCNHLLDDHAALEAFYQENGYVLLRGVFDLDVVAEARDAMLKVASDLGLTEPGDITGKWTGKPSPGGLEESPIYSGISKRLLEHPTSLAVLEKVLGEKPCAMPNVQYRNYPPHSPLGTVHQDGFYSPGIQDYKPVWVPLTPCTREMGGLAIAVKQNQRGYFHNTAKPNPFPIPKDAIPADAWATTDYMPGDVLIVNPYTPHTGLANNSDRLRVSFDSRVQSAANPSAFAANVKSATPTTVTVSLDDGSEKTFTVDEDTYIRINDPGIREKLEGFETYTKIGARIVVVKDGDRAVMLRRASEG